MTEKQEIGDFTKCIIEHFEARGEMWVREWLTEKPTILNWACDGSCGTLTEDYNEKKERCLGCPTPRLKKRRKNEN